MADCRRISIVVLVIVVASLHPQTCETKGCPFLLSLLGFPLVCTGGLAATVYFTITGTEYNAPACFHFSYTLAGGLTIILCPARKDANPDHRYVLSEEKLYLDLLKKYVKDIRPSNGTVQLSFGATLVNIIGLMWKDFRLKWNPAEYDGVYQLRIDIRDLWTPDIVLFNSMEGINYRYIFDALAVVYSDGTVLWIPPMRAKSSCKLDFTWFPFDEQTCLLKFGSWTYDGLKVNLSHFDALKSMDLTEFTNHTEWIVLGSTAQINNKYYSCCQEPYQDVTFSVKLRRDAGYYRRLFIGPAALMALLAPFMFMLPPGTGEKTTLGVGILIILGLCIMMLDYYIGPAQSSNAVLGYFYYVTFVMVSLSTALAALVSNMAVRGPRAGSPPAWMKKIFLDIIGRLVCVSRDTKPYGPLQTEAVQADMNSDTSTIIRTSDQNPHGVRDFQLIAMVLDRILFVVSVLVFILITISTVAK